MSRIDNEVPKLQSDEMSALRTQLRETRLLLDDAQKSDAASKLLVDDLKEILQQCVEMLADRDQQIEEERQKSARLEVLLEEEMATRTKSRSSAVVVEEITTNVNKINPSSSTIGSIPSQHRLVAFRSDEKILVAMKEEVESHHQEGRPSTINNHPQDPLPLIHAADKCATSPKKLNDSCTTTNLNGGNVMLKSSVGGTPNNSSRRKMWSTMAAVGVVVVGVYILRNRK